MTPFIILLICAVIVGILGWIVLDHPCGLIFGPLVFIIAFVTGIIFTAGTVKSTTIINSNEYFVTINKDVAAYIFIPKANQTLIFNDIVTFKLIESGEFIINYVVTNDCWGSAEIHHYNVLQKSK